MSVSRRTRPFVIGVTGNIACGKSAVVTMLSRKGAASIDSDHVYHQLIEPGKPLWQALRDHFGTSIIDNNGRIDRRALGAIVFRDPAELAALDALTHPAVIEAIEQLITSSDASVVVVDAVKLVESGMATRCDAVWLVECDRDVQLDRLMRRNQLTQEEALMRIAAQPDLVFKRTIANERIDNSGSLSETQSQVDEAWARIPLLPS